MTSRDYLRRPTEPDQEGPSLVMLFVLVNLVAFLLPALFAPPMEVPPGAVSIDALVAGQWWTVFTQLFVHANWWHLLPNMVLFVIVARLVVRDTGPWHFTSIYLVSGVVGSAAQMAAYPHSAVTGASASVGGLFGVFAAMHPYANTVERLRGILPWRLSARSLFWGFFAASLFLAVAVHFTPPDSPRIAGIHDVAHLAHAAGMLSGWLYGRRLASDLHALPWQQDFFPQGLRRRHMREEEQRFAPAGRVRSSVVTEQTAPVIPPPAPRVLSDQEFLQEEVDPILEKLYSGGMASLTERERAVLDEAARRVARDRRESR